MKRSYSVFDKKNPLYSPLLVRHCNYEVYGSGHRYGKNRLPVTEG